MVLELMGVPGCGKSTYAVNYLCEHNAVNIMDIYLYSQSRVVQNINKIKLVWYMLFYHSAEFNRLLKCFLNVRFVSKTKQLKMMLYLYSVLGVIQKGKRKSDGRDIIIDEGINQVIWGILYNSRESEVEVLELHKQLIPYFAEKIVWLDVEKEVIKDRLVNRTTRGGAELKQDVLNNEDSIVEAYRYIDLICSAMSNLGLAERISKV